MNSVIKGIVGLSVVAAVAGIAGSPTLAAKDFSVKPVAGRTTTGGDDGRWVGGGADAKAYRNADGSYTLTKTATTETWAYAALQVGVEGITLDDLGTLTYTVDGDLTNGSPRVNLSYDDPSTEGDDFLFLGGLASADENGVVTVDLAGITPDAGATALSLSIIRDEQGSSIVSDIGFTG
jgi:hypothetical protein